MIPLTKSWGVFISEDSVLDSCPSIANFISFSLFSSSVAIGAAGFSINPEVEGSLGGASTALISSNFSSN